MAFTAQILNIEVDKTSSTSTTLDKQFDWAIECKFDSSIKPITAIRVNGGSSGDTWQTPFNSYYWIISPYKVNDQTLRLYFSKSQSQTKFMISIQYTDGTMDYGYALSINDTIDGFPAKPVTLITNVPKEILDTYNKLIIDENKNVRGVRVGRNWIHGSKHVLDAIGYYGNPTSKKFAGDYTISEYANDIGEDNTCYELPPIGTKIWQLKLNNNIIRTSRITGYTGSVVSDTNWPSSILARLTADGPYPGVPIGGDSGSVCLYLDKNGVVRVLGVCGLAGTCFVATPALWPSDWNYNLTIRPILKYNGTSSWPTPIDPPITNKDWYAGMTQTITNALNIPMETDTTLPPSPTPTNAVTGVIIKNTQDVIGPGNSSGSNGIPDNCIKLYNVTKPYKTIRITGVRGDTWETPYNIAVGYWNIKVINDNTTLTCYFEPSNPTTSFNVTITHTDGTISNCVAVPGTEPTPPVVEPTPQPTPECDCAKLQSDLDKYKKAIDDIKAIVNSL